jgi:hypothetical protein
MAHTVMPDIGGKRPSHRTTHPTLTNPGRLVRLLGQEILDIPVAEAEAEVEVETIREPICVADDIWREAMPFVCIHWQILPITAT